MVLPVYCEGQSQPDGNDMKGKRHRVDVSKDVRVELGRIPFQVSLPSRRWSKVLRSQKKDAEEERRVGQSESRQVRVGGRLERPIGEHKQRHDIADGSQTGNGDSSNADQVVRNEIPEVLNVVVSVFPEVHARPWRPKTGSSVAEILKLGSIPVASATQLKHEVHDLFSVLLCSKDQVLIAWDDLVGQNFTNLEYYKENSEPQIIL